jgi:hypothetical protein
MTVKRGLDFGLTSACVFTQVTPEGRWPILDELGGDDVGISTFADRVVQTSVAQAPFTIRPQRTLCHPLDPRSRDSTELLIWFSLASRLSGVRTLRVRPRSNCKARCGRADFAWVSS